MIKPVVTYVVVADAAMARFYKNMGPGSGLSPLPEHSMSGDVPKGQDIMADDRGRAFSSVGSHRSGMEPKTDPRELVEIEFLRSLSEKLDELQRASAFDRLIIAAAPKALGEIRKALSPAVQGQLEATLDKDLTKTPGHELAKHFEGVMAV